MNQPKGVTTLARLTPSACEARPRRHIHRLALVLTAALGGAIPAPTASRPALPAPLAGVIGDAGQARLCPVSRCGPRTLERDSFLEFRDRAEVEIYFKEVRARELVYV